MSSADCMLDGRYQLRRWIATGAVGEVWEGLDLVLDRPVAVKLLRPEYLQHDEALARFRAEARHAGSLSHPGIAQVYDYRQAGSYDRRPAGSYDWRRAGSYDWRRAGPYGGSQAGQPEPPYLVMEFVDGPPLTQVLRRESLGPARTMDIVAQAAAALAAAHAAGLVHRDIKPGNLLIGPGGKVKITDFGIAHAAGSAPLTQTGMLVGTPAYMAPERVNGCSGGPASDLYSLGIVAYECLTGAVPFTGSVIEVALAHQRGALPPLPEGLPEAVTALVTALTAKNPADRPGSAAEVATAAGRIRAVAAIAAAGETAADVSAAPAGSALAATLTGLEPVASAGAVRAGAVRAGAAWAGAAWAGAASARVARAGSAWAGAARAGAARAGAVLRPESWAWSRGGRRPAWAAMAAVSVVLAAAIIGLLMTRMSASAAPHRHPAAAPAPPRSSSASPGPSSPAVGLVSLTSRPLVGKPVGVVVEALRKLDLNPRVVWATTGAQPPGTVISIRPSGVLPPESTVTVTAARPPASDPPGPARHHRVHHQLGHHKHGKGHGGGGD